MINRSINGTIVKHISIILVITFLIIESCVYYHKFVLQNNAENTFAFYGDLLGVAGISSSREKGLKYFDFHLFIDRYSNYPFYRDFKRDSLTFDSLYIESLDTDFEVYPKLDTVEFLEFYASTYFTYEDVFIPLEVDSIFLSFDVLIHYTDSVHQTKKERISKTLYRKKEKYFSLLR